MGEVAKIAPKLVDGSIRHRFGWRISLSLFPHSHTHRRIPELELSVGGTVFSVVAVKARSVLLQLLLQAQN